MSKSNRFSSFGIGAESVEDNQAGVLEEGAASAAPAPIEEPAEPVELPLEEVEGEDFTSVATGEEDEIELLEENAVALEAIVASLESIGVGCGREATPLALTLATQAANTHRRNVGLESLEEFPDAKVALESVGETLKAVRDKIIEVIKRMIAKVREIYSQLTGATRRADAAALKKAEDFLDKAEKAHRKVMEEGEGQQRQKPNLDPMKDLKIKLKYNWFGNAINLENVADVFGSHARHYVNVIQTYERDIISYLDKAIHALDLQGNDGFHSACADFASHVLPNMMKDGDRVFGDAFKAELEIFLSSSNKLAISNDVKVIREELHKKIHYNAVGFIANGEIGSFEVTVKHVNMERLEGFGRAVKELFVENSKVVLSTPLTSFEKAVNERLKKIEGKLAGSGFLTMNDEDFILFGDVCRAAVKDAERSISYVRAYYGVGHKMRAEIDSLGLQLMVAYGSAMFG